MNDWQRMVRDFNVKFGATVGDSPAIRDPELRAALIEEEAKETIDAIKAGDLVGAVDGICDLIYVAVGAAVAFGVELGPVFNEVHRSNMAKEGGPTRPDGKVLKPAGWTPPRIAELLAQQPQFVTVKGADGTTQVVPAEIVGGLFAVHLSIAGRTDWTLTHIRTGHAVLYVDRRDDAIKIGQELADMGLAVWLSDDPAVIAHETPPTVADWIRQCRRTGGYVPFPRPRRDAAMGG